MRPGPVAIVDDDSSVAKALVRLARSAGYEAVSFTLGEDILNYLESEDSRLPSCIVLDVRMPTLSGLEVQARINELSLGLPIVFISAHATATERDRAMVAGALTFLDKPFDDDRFLEAVRRATDSDTRGATP